MPTSARLRPAALAAWTIVDASSFMRLWSARASGSATAKPALTVTGIRVPLYTNGVCSTVERMICGRLKIVGRFELTVPLLHEEEARVGVREIQGSAGSKDARNNMCPSRYIRQPANRSPGNID